MGDGTHTWAEVRSQPDVWLQAADVVPELERLLPEFGRLAIIGCGTSWFVAQACAALWERSGRGEADAFTASETPLGRRYDVLVAVSRSGTTTEVVRLLETAPARTTVAVTAVADTPVADAASAVVVLDFADEQSVVQTRFATSVVALWRAMLGEPVRPLAEQARRALAGPLPVSIAGFDHVVFLATGWAIGLAHEAALKLREAAGARTESYPATEFRHGPVSATGPTSLVWSLGPVPDDVLEDAAVAGATVLGSGNDPLVDLVRVHRAAIELASARGRDPDRPAYLTRSVILTGADSGRA